MSSKNNIHWTESFRPINSNDTKIDTQNNIWKKITANGWVRQCDNFFWPADPTSSDNYLGKFPHSVEQIKTMRNQYK